MLRTLESALVVPVSLTLLLLFASLVFPAYASFLELAKHENQGQRKAAGGKQVYEAYYAEGELPQLESHVDAYKDLLLIVEDNTKLLKGSFSQTTLAPADINDAGGNP